MNNPDRNPRRGESRRSFLKKTAVVAGAAAAGDLWCARGEQAAGAVALVFDDTDPVLQQAPAQWAMGHLRDVLAADKVSVTLKPVSAGVADGEECILAATGASEFAKACLAKAGLQIPRAPEAFALARAKMAVPSGGSSAGSANKRQVLTACGSDARGLVYALLELADRATFAPEPMAELKHVRPSAAEPANQIRSVARLFASDVEDKPWYNDRSFWQRYLTQLATHRFNRFNFTLGLGYDFTTDIHDAYFHFAYPFLLSLPGYSVRAVPLPDEERDRNLEMLRFISQETARRGLQFQLGLWTHAYKWGDSPHANYVIEGLTPENHGAYCRDSLAALLQACPAISGVTLRIHGESGVAEGSYEFWRMVFDGVVRSGRRVEIDLHAKGIDEKMIDLALATGMPVNVSPKFWAEHMGLGYMQGAIRPQEMPPRDEQDRGFFAMSTGSRRFLRYGYGDLLREDRKYGVLHRVWPGTQRLLLWGNPKLAADYGRASSFCGSLGVEWLEPLSFKGRKGSGLPGGRDAYADASLKPAGDDFEKYRYSYRVWGRHIYNPDCDPEEYRRALRHEFGKAAAPVEAGLREAGYILPLFLTAHCPSASNNNYWPEMYTNMTIVSTRPTPYYSDTLSPKHFGTVSSLDPEFFSRIDDFAADLLKGAPHPRNSPLWVAEALQKAAAAATTAWAQAHKTVKDPVSAPFRRAAEDVAIQCGLGNFFAWKLRAGVLFAIAEQAKSREALEQSLRTYRKARDIWAGFAERAKPVYRSDVTFGPEHFQRGHWLDRLGLIDADIADMEKLLGAMPAGGSSDSVAVQKAIDAITHGHSGERLGPVAGMHQPPQSFRAGTALPVEFSVGHGGQKAAVTSVMLRYRHVNQGEEWKSCAMEPREKVFRATIPGDYAASPFPLQYHFEVHYASGLAHFFPGFEPAWKGQPYYVVRQQA